MIIDGISDTVILYSSICFIGVFYMVYAIISKILSSKKSRNYFYHDDNLIDDNECPICLENNNNNAYFICKHNCCIKCVNDLINRIKPCNFNCFLCRKTVQMIIYNNNFNQSEQYQSYTRNINEYNTKNLNSFSYYVSLS